MGSYERSFEPAVIKNTHTADPWGAHP